MASNNGGAELGTAMGGLLQLIFTLTFPMLLITLCGASYLIVTTFHAPEFALWAYLASLAIDYAKTNTWAEVALIIFALAAVPLAWVALREQELRVSSAISAYVAAGLIGGFLFWLRTVWPFDEKGWGGWQIIAYGVIMFFAWIAVIEAALVTIGIAIHAHQNRPRPVRPPPHEPHGSRRERRRARRNRRAGREPRWHDVGPDTI